MQQLLFSFARFIIAPALVTAGIIAAQPSLPSPATSPAPPQPQVSASDNSASLNWAGYVSQDQGTYSGISGSWIIPHVQDTPGTADATWVGVGGVVANDLLQAGTQAIIDKQGAIQYEAWYEALPGYSITVPLTVHPGDAITTSLTETQPDVWKMTISDVTTDHIYSTNIAYQSSHSSAEWIEEMVSNDDYTFRPLDEFGAVPFTGGSVVLDGATESISQSGAHALSMVNSAGGTLATPSKLIGDTFTVARGNASPDSGTVPQLQSANSTWFVVTMNLPRTDRRHPRRDWSSD